MQTIIISDIHIGTNYKTCWYQKSVHEPYMIALLDHIIANANKGSNPIDRLVILGDLFDFWTYPPSMTLPAIDDILAANPNLFGANGKFAEVIQALNGNVQYIHGNHDILLTQADLDKIPGGGHQIQLLPDVYRDASGIVFTHGHLGTMFNAPDPRYPGQVPVGHFVTRAISHMLDGMLTGNQTAADLPNQGSPYGFSLSSLIPNLSSQFSNPSITNILLGYIAQRCQLPLTTPIQMAAGEAPMTIAAAMTKFDGLFMQWVGQNGGGETGTSIAAKSAQADYDGSYMAWFAQRFAFENSAKGVVMGHTHIPKVGIAQSWCDYVNSGFECPSVPDIQAGRTHWNFTTVAPDGTMQLMQVTDAATGYRIQPTSAPQDHMGYPPFMDFSCYVRIVNNGPTDLVRTGQHITSGFFATQPPAVVPAGETASYWIEDLAGPRGSDGDASYKSDAAPVTFSASCPTGFLFNSASGGGALRAGSGNSPAPNAPLNSVPKTGHPLFVEFFVQKPVAATDRVAAPMALAAAAPAWTPTSALAKAVDLAGFDYDPAQDIIFSKMNPLQRNFGYAYGYDVAALTMSAVIDCEPVFFDYDGKTWMIELWKGQYGLETGCEIGVYTRPIGSSGPAYFVLDHTVGRRPYDPAPERNQYFDCAADSDLLVISSTLYRNGEKLFSREAQPHWWLTGFKWGVFSNPEDLIMDVSITCKDAAMTAAFVAALKSMGYGNVKVSGTNVSFTFATPFTPQPRAGNPLVPAVQAQNAAIVKEYNALGLASNDPNKIPDGDAGQILKSVSIYAARFFSQVVADLAKGIGIDATQLLTTLAQKFMEAAAAAANYLTQAGYSLSSWISSLETVLGINLDFSCVIEIANSGPAALTKANGAIIYGDYVIPPPATIAPGETVRFWLKDPKPSVHGAQGWVFYTFADANGQNRGVTFNFDCPTGFYSNAVSISPGSPFNFYAQSGSYSPGNWGRLNSTPSGGHPLYVAIVWGVSPPPS